MNRKNKNNKPYRLDRNMAAKPLTNFHPIQMPDSAKDLGIVAAFENNRYGVFVKQSVSYGFSIPTPGGGEEPMPVDHLIIFRLDKKVKEPTWSEKMFIVDQIVGERCDVVELFPAKFRRMSTIPDHQTHLWALPMGVQMPVGLIPKELAQDMENYVVTKEEIEVFVIEGKMEGDEYVEVFADEEEARKMYEAAGNDMPGGKIGRIGEVPLEENGAAWTDAAKAKVANVLAKAEKGEMDTTGRKALKDDESGVTRINVNGPITDQDELEDEYGVPEESPPGLEEQVMMKEFMAMGVSQIQRERQKNVEKATKDVPKEGEEEEFSEESNRGLVKKWS
jgi:hypothetical protein